MSEPEVEAVVVAPVAEPVPPSPAEVPVGIQEAQEIDEAQEAAQEAQETAEAAQETAEAAAEVAVGAAEVAEPAAETAVEAASTAEQAGDRVSALEQEMRESLRSLHEKIDRLAPKEPVTEEVTEVETELPGPEGGTTVDQSSGQSERTRRHRFGR